MAAEGQNVSNTVKVSVPLRFLLGPCLGRLLTDHCFVRQEQVCSRGIRYGVLGVSGVRKLLSDDQGAHVSGVIFFVTGCLCD
jgi:hypothetical protein